MDYFRFLFERREREKVSLRVKRDYITDVIDGARIRLVTRFEKQIEIRQVPSPLPRLHKSPLRWESSFSRKASSRCSAFMKFDSISWRLDQKKSRRTTRSCCNQSREIRLTEDVWRNVWNRETTSFCWNDRLNMSRILFSSEKMRIAFFRCQKNDSCHFLHI